MHHGGEQLQGLAIVPAAAAQHLALDGQAGQGTDFLPGQQPSPQILPYPLAACLRRGKV